MFFKYSGYKEKLSFHNIIVAVMYLKRYFGTIRTVDFITWLIAIYRMGLRISITFKRYRSTMLIIVCLN